MPPTWETRFRLRQLARHAVIQSYALQDRSRLEGFVKVRAERPHPEPGRRYLAKPITFGLDYLTPPQLVKPTGKKA